jgi:hypothetical protein
LKFQEIYTQGHCVTTEKTRVFSNTIVRTSNLAFLVTAVDRLAETVVGIVKEWILRHTYSDFSPAYNKLIDERYALYIKSFSNGCA